MNRRLSACRPPHHQGPFKPVQQLSIAARASLLRPFKLASLGAIAAGFSAIQQRPAFARGTRLSASPPSEPLVVGDAPPLPVHSDADQPADAAEQASTSGCNNSMKEESTGLQGSALRFNAAASMIPYPGKMTELGEDAAFIADDGLSLGVADGVGSWIEQNVDAGEYARQLMVAAKEAAARRPPSKEAPRAILVEAHANTRVLGSSTACIVVMAGEMLHAANLGDSGFLVVRDDQVLVHSPQQQHSFNFPFQLGRAGLGMDSPFHAQLFSVPLRAGDIVVAATDGVWDNVYPDECATVVSEVAKRGDKPAIAAAALAHLSHLRGNDDHFLTPFAAGAKKANMNFHGGKLDDITAVVAYVAPTSKL